MAPPLPAAATASTAIAPEAFDAYVEVFVRAFAFGRSFTHPFLVAAPAPGLWVLSDAPRGGANPDWRSDEIIAYRLGAHGLTPADVDAVVRARPRPRVAVGVMREMGEADGPIRSAFKGLGYRLIATEPFMVRGLEGDGPTGAPIDHPPAPPRPFTIVRVRDEPTARLLAKAARRRQILPEHLSADPPPMRSYVAFEGRTPVGWVNSVAVGDMTWCSNLFVIAPKRRLGLGGALMRRMLIDDRAAGARASVLLASHTGARVYPGVGYVGVGELLIFVPAARPGRSGGG
ncbi:MAG: GNAT family N-acetyltransferase [Ardenticatenales bacterium]